MCGAWPARGQEGRRRREQGREGERRAEEGRRKSARSPAASPQLLSLPQLSGENRRNGDEPTTYLGETARRWVYCLFCYRGFCGGLGRGVVIINVSHSCIHSFGGGAASSVSGQGRGGECGARSGLPTEDGDGRTRDPRPTLSYLG